MFHIRKIDSLDLPELAPYRTLRRAAEHETRGIFVAEGDKVVRRLLESQCEVLSVVLPEKRLESYRPLLTARREPDLPVFAVTDMKVLEELVGFSLYQGVLAIGKIPAPATLSEVLERLAPPRLLAAVDGLTSAENLGALVRNCAAFGVQALIVGETSTSPFLRRAVRNSMGTILTLPVIELARLGQRHQWTDKPQAHHQTLAQCLQHLRTRGIRCIAAHPHTDQRSLSDADFTSECCVVFGSEGHGISPAVLAACDEAVAIPMPPEVDSLNVGAAGAVFFYEAKRQRRHL
jgi:tRNA(Leu) C34 or U34 (ribose-2'-O)-methylase TrmL